MAKIGIGITTFNRPECLDECLAQIELCTDMTNVKLHIAIDSTEDRKGIAYRKNECLRALKDCDYIFLFDDDCFPVKDGWIDFFIQNAGNNHVLFLNNKQHNYSYTSSVFPKLMAYTDCGGVFMYIPKEALEKVGAFDEKFVGYGFEHCNWSMRWNDRIKMFYMIKGTEEYLYSHDYSNSEHKSSITEQEKDWHISNNWSKFFNETIEKIYLPL